MLGMYICYMLTGLCCHTMSVCDKVPYQCCSTCGALALSAKQLKGNPALFEHTHTHTHTHTSVTSMCRWNWRQVCSVTSSVQVEPKTGVFSDQQCAGGTEDGCFVSGFQWLPGDPNTCTLCGSYLYSTNTALRFWPHTVMKRRGLGGQSKGVRLAVCVQCTVYVYCEYT